jgi:hypothetical protein
MAAGVGAAGAAPSLAAVTSNGPSGQPAAAIPSFGSSSTRCRLDDDRIDESSGLAVSTWDPARLWTHNDSGDRARMFALGPPTGGRCPTIGVLNLAGIDAFDAEDLAPGPGHSLWLADIGDNIGQRARIVLDRVEEPQTIAGDQSVPAQRYRLAYPDGPHNAEALLVSPRSGEIVIVTKGSSSKPLVYAAPAGLADQPAPAGVTRLRGLGELNAPEAGGLFEAISGGAVSPDGRLIVLRTYLDAYVYSAPDGNVAAALLRPPRRFPLPSQPQGESVAFTPDGRSILLSSEGTGTDILSLRRDDGTTPVGRLVGGNRNVRPVVIGVTAALLLVVLVVLFRRRRVR